MKVQLNCSCCGSVFFKEKREYNTRLRLYSNPNFFCSKTCYSKFKTIDKLSLRCDECNKTYQVDKREYKRKSNQTNSFCSRNCANTFLGRNRSEEQRTHQKKLAKKWCEENYKKVLEGSDKAYKSITSKNYFCSKGEKEVFSYMKENSNLLIQSGGSFTIGLKEGKSVRKQFDIFCKETKTIIEYDGECHFNPIYGKDSFSKTVMKDIMLDKWCKDNKWSLIRIKEDIYKKDKDKWLSILLNHLENSELEYIKYY